MSDPRIPPASQNPEERRAAAADRRWLACLFSCCLAMASLVETGCRIDNIDSARRAAKIASFGSKPLVKVKRRNPMEAISPIRRLIVGRPNPSPRTLLFLRKNNLLEEYVSAPTEVVNSLRAECRGEPSMESVHAMAELAQMEADWKARTRQKTEAAEYYVTAVIHAYKFLFDPSLDIQRNAYDPQFREICDIYNHSLENLLRIICTSSNFKPGSRHYLGDQDGGVEFDVVIEGRWQEQEFERFELVNDFEVSGIENNYHTFGLGVPLVAIRKAATENNSQFEKYYPPSLALPMTAFCEVLPSTDPNSSTQRAVLRLFDPLERMAVTTATGKAPLESDLTVPLAYYLNDPLLNTEVFSTVALLNADVASEFFGFYMLEPYDPGKIPVVMVHGLWSNPVTWMKMFNDLRAHPAIRERYQFWFYMYPTGQPFWISAANMRRELTDLRHDVDPDGQSRAMQEMIFVGHSMGGLLSRMQVIDSGDRFWQIVSDQPIDQIRGSTEIKQEIRSLFYFEANPAIARVITIASPHRGSSYANTVTRWLSHQAFSLPKRLTASFSEFVDDNQSMLRNTKHLTIPTSVDSLASDSPFIQALAAVQPNPATEFHNIYGNVKKSALFKQLGSSSPSDGVVSVSSAALPNAVSEIEVPAEHMEVHQHPETILEIKRILLDHLADRAPPAFTDHRLEPASHTAESK